MTIAEHAAQTRDMLPHTDTLTRLAAEATTILELGVRTGISTWALLDGLPEDGRLVSVDVDGSVAMQVADRVRTDPRWTLVVGDDLRVWLPIECADLVFIDTSHKYEHTIRELHLAASMGACVIALHDWMLEPVRAAVRTFTEPPSAYYVTEVEPSEWGLAVLRCQ